MAAGLPGGNSFMEDYTYHLRPGRPHKCWARTCSKSAPASPLANRRCEIHPLGIGGKEDPVRLVFNCPAGAGHATPPSWTWATVSA
ncbi:MAG: hypothetical protein WKG07_12040 [Hymenobacter sp.]